MNIVKHMKFADLFTISNLSCGLLSILSSVRHRFLASVLFILAAVFFDFLDGLVARILNQKNVFGRELDSLSDIVSFGVAPAIFFYVQSAMGFFVTLSILFFVACALLRLARFNISRRGTYVGVPITVSGVLFAVLGFISMAVPSMIAYWPVVFIVMGFLMVSTIPVRKVFS
jgi:CDP-diacylglycerol--serine O-phosphatidyltransferase